MHRQSLADFMEPALTPDLTPTNSPSGFVPCPQAFTPAAPIQQCLAQGLLQLAYQQALQQNAPPRLPRFSWN